MQDPEDILTSQINKAYMTPYANHPVCLYIYMSKLGTLVPNTRNPILTLPAPF